MMRYVKFVMTAMVALLCFMMSSELFQLHLQVFSNQYFYIDIGNNVNSSVCSLVSSVSKKYGEHVFTIERQSIDAFHSKVFIYTDDARDILLAQDIKEGKSVSFFSGTTEVEISPMREIKAADSIRYYFTGSKDTVSSIRQDIYSQIATSYIHKEGVVITENLIYGVWIASLGFILLLTWLDIQFSRKEDFLKISMGASFTSVILTKILNDLAVNAVIFSAIYIILKDKISLSYRLDFVCLALFTFALFNSLLYLTLASSDYKEIIYGANINDNLLANACLLQAIIVVLTVVAMSSNLTLIKEGIKELAPYDTIERLDGYTSLSISTDGSVLQDVDVPELETKIYLEAYAQSKVLLSTFCAAIDDEPVVVLNESALNTVVSEPGLLQTESSADFIVFIPQSKQDEVSDYDVEFSAATTASNFFGLENYNFETKSYSHEDVVYFDLRKESELSYGSDIFTNPIIVYCNLSAERLGELLKNHTVIDLGDRWANIMFDLRDVSLLSDEVKEKADNITFSSVTDICNQYKMNLVRDVTLNSVLSIFLILLSVLLISVIVKMEYLVRSKELALKKLLGYSILQRNMAIFVLNFFSVFIAFITGAILLKMYDIFSILTLCITSAIVLFVGFALILRNILVVEKRSSIHILKGEST